MNNGCQAGCKVFTGGEVKHHPDCQYYPESFSKLYDDLLTEVKKLRKSSVMPSLPHDEVIVAYVNKNLSTKKISERERILILATIKCINNGKLSSGNGA